MSVPPTKIMKIGSGSWYFLLLSKQLDHLLISSSVTESIKLERVLEFLKTGFPGSVSSNATNSNSTERNIAKLFANEVYKLEDFVIVICTDVLTEVLSFGSRLRLGKLEGVGRRFHLVVENSFREVPSIRMGFDLTARFTIFLNVKSK